MSGNEISEPYITGLSFAPVHIKDERLDDQTSEELSSTIQFHQSPGVISASQLKREGNHILNTGKVTIADQVETISNHRSVLVTSNSSSSKGLSNHTIIPISQGVTFSSTGLTLSNMNSLTTDNNLVPSTLSGTIMNQPLQVYQSTYDNCDNALESQPNSGQTFLLTSPNSMLTSNQIMSQGQVFIQGDELVSVSLPTTVANSYTLSGTNAQFGSAMSVIQGSQGVNAASRRLIIHPNQSNSANISNPVVSAHNGHYLIQVGNSLSSISTNSNLSINNKGHIVIRSGVSKNKTDHDDALDSLPKDGIFRVIIPEGTTKLPKPVHPVKIINAGEEAIRKHVQINLSNRSTYSPTKLANLDPVTTQPAKIQFEEKPLANPHRKLYECTNCCSKFMKALYLRMHIRSCKKPEVKLEKSPLYMCSFCKTTFKIKSLINLHFAKCKSCPFAMKEAAEKREMEINEDNIPPSKRAKLMELDSSLEQAIQYKCQDCDRTFNKERQYTSHVKRCTKVSVHDMSALKMETMVESINDEEHDWSEDPFADPPPFPTPSTTKRGRGGGGRRGRPPGRMPNAAQKAAQKSNSLFEGEKLEATFSGLIVADNENLVRSTTGLAHTLQLSLETSLLEGHPQPSALVSDSKGIRSREKPPQAWSLVCSLCQKMFLTKVALANHVIENHGEELKTTRNILQGQSKENNDLFKCPVCNLHYLSGQHFLEHLVMQHTNKLQECHKALQSQTASFICSLCSLVLLTKNLLLEHLSLEHLEELEKIQASMLYTKKRKHKQTGDSSENADDAVYKTDPSFIQECLPEDWKYEDENILECRYCGEESESLESLKSHYINTHGVETDASGDIMDEGVDVDIRIKDTHALIKLADGKINDAHLPHKTVLIRKKPKQSWQCQSCQQIFTRQAVWLKHVRDTCPSLNTNKENNKSSTRECRFYCIEPECCQLAFLQFKSLVKHKEEVHSIIVKKERKVFENLPSFYQWLSLEEQKENLHFIRDSTRIEKNNVRLIQMVCHRFHTAKNDQSKDKEDSDFNKPTKKRWCVRMQKENNCYARIFLRSEFDYSRKDYDGETQVIYYSEHFHNGIEDTPELLESMREKYPLTKQPNSKSNGAIDGDSGSSQGIDSPGDMFMEDGESSSLASDPINMDESSQLLEYTPSTSNAVIFSDNGSTTNAMNNVGILSAHSSASRESRLILSHNSVDTTSSSGLILESSGETRFVIPSRMREGNIEQKAILVEGGDSNTFMVMDVDQRDGDTEQELSEEYVLPADESEWTKLFDVLSERISSGELFGEEKKEAETLISYRNLLPITSIHQQVDIFQRMCSLTNIESS